MNPLRQFFALALLLSAASAAADGGAPEGAHLSQLDSRLSVAKRARITTRDGVAIVSDMRATPAGISYHNLMISQGSDSLRSSGVIEWKEIREVETTDGTPSLWLKPLGACARGRWPGTGGVLRGGRHHHIVERQPVSDPVRRHRSRGGIWRRAVCETIRLGLADHLPVARDAQFSRLCLTCAR